MMEHLLETDSFRLCLELKINENDIKYPENTIMTVTVSSAGFSATNDMDIDIKEFAVFAKELVKLYETLNGTAAIKEPYGYEKYISFSDNNTGHITVKGYLCDELRENELRFENKFDQTYLKAFSYELLSAYSKYKK